MKTWLVWIDFNECGSALCAYWCCWTELEWRLAEVMLDRTMKNWNIRPATFNLVPLHFVRNLWARVPSAGTHLDSSRKNRIISQEPNRPNFTGRIFCSSEFRFLIQFFIIFHLLFTWISICWNWERLPATGQQFQEKQAKDKVLVVGSGQVSYHCKSNGQKKNVDRNFITDELFLNWTVHQRCRKCLLTLVWRKWAGQPDNKERADKYISIHQQNVSILMKIDCGWRQTPHISARVTVIKTDWSVSVGHLIALLVDPIH